MYSYKYCPNCKGPFSKVNRNLYLCPKCEFRIYLNPKPAVAAIIRNKKGQILLSKRSYDPGKGKWTLIGGFMDPEENANESLEREILEEIGVKINKFKYFGSFTCKYLYKDINYDVISFMYTATIPSNANIKISDEATEFKFFDIDKINFDDIALEDDLKALKKYLGSKSITIK